MKLTHVLSIDQFDKSLIEELFYHANWISKAKGHSISHLRGKLLANLFYEASTRTSSSFFAAMSRLGGRVLPINDVTFSSVSKGEILEDTIRTLACYTDIIVLRHPEMGRRNAPLPYRPSRSSMPATEWASTRPRRCSTFTPSWPNRAGSTG